MGYHWEDRPCPVCGSTDAVLLGRRSPRSASLAPDLQAVVVRCRECALIYPRPLPIPDRAQFESNYGDEAEYFPEAVNEARLARARSVLERVEAGLEGKGRLLDVGCGRGELVAEAARRGWEAFGLDPSPRFVESARRSFGGNILCGEPSSSGLPGASFDAVTMISVLQHARDPLGVLRGVADLLKPGGLLLLETMNHDGLYYRAAELYNRAAGNGLTPHLSPTFPSFELYGFSAGPLKRSLAAAGLRLEKLEVLGGISRMKPPAEGIRESVLRSLTKAVMLAAQCLGQGQVLLAWARKEKRP